MTQTRGRPHVVGVCGSLRGESRTRIALEDVLAASREAGATTELVDLRAYDLPNLNAVDGTVDDAESLRTLIGDADGVVLATPNYHGSYSGALKNALDYCGRDDLEGATVGLLEVAGGRFPGSASTHLRTVCRALGGWVLPTAVAIPNSRSTVSDDGIRDDAIADRAHRLGVELVRYAGVSNYPRTVDVTRESAVETEI